MSKYEQSELERLEGKLRHRKLNKQERARYTHLIDLQEDEQELAFLRSTL